MESQDQEHIVMLPFMAQGHLISFLQLARNLQQRKSLITVTVASTALNFQYLHTTIASNSSSQSDSNIRLAKLSFCSTDHDLPPYGENTENLPLSKIGNLGAASTSLESPTHRFISDIIEKEGRPSLCIISDIFGTALVTFTTGGAYGTAAFVSIWLNLPHRSIASDEFPLSLSTKSFGWLCSTVEEIEPFGFKILRNYLGCPVWSIGPLLPLEALNKSSTLASTAMGDGFIACDITFENNAGPSKHQAVTLRVGVDKSVIFRCSMVGYQDTLYTLSKRQFYRDTQIYGTVDFIFGNSAAVF
ncbi:hypothetical protein ACFX13_032484 [Malus domestica]